MEVIEHYKKKLLRHIEEPDVVLYCLKKLDTVPVTIEILQDSEVGKVVNRLKKRTDTTPDVIEASKTLVEKWKELVKNTNEDETDIPTAEHETAEAVMTKSKTPSSSEKKSSSKSHHHKKDKKDKKSSSSSSSNHHHHKHHKSSKESSSSKKSTNGSSTSIEIPSDINPNYKPPKIRHFESSSTGGGNASRNGGSKVNTEDDDMLSRLITGNKSLKNRTAVYSGRKTSAFSRDEKFPTLEELCVHVLQDNIHLIDECGNASFDQMKPILGRAKADDLIRIEDFNPRLMEDTGELWERHVKKTFPRAERQEYESYREMYERLVQEREEKLEKLMGTVKNSYAKIKTNNKQIKLAYVDTVAKPPRGVKRAQEKNGTYVPVGSSLDKAKKARMASKSDFSSAASSSSSTVTKKAKVAPIMAKTLKMVRGLKTGGFRR